MLLFPNVQTRAQEELDRVVGRDRLPDFSDRKLLPFIQCIVYETARYVSMRAMIETAILTSYRKCLGGILQYHSVRLPNPLHDV